MSFFSRITKSVKSVAAAPFKIAGSTVKQGTNFIKGTVKNPLDFKGALTAGLINTGLPAITHPKETALVTGLGAAGTYLTGAGAAAGSSTASGAAAGAGVGAVTGAAGAGTAAAVTGGAVGAVAGSKLLDKATEAAINAAASAAVKKSAQAGEGKTYARPDAGPVPGAPAKNSFDTKTLVIGGLSLAALVATLAGR